MDLGDLRFQVIVDTDDLKRAKSEVGEFSDEARQSGKSTTELGNDLKRTGNQGRRSISGLVRALNENTSATRSAASQTKYFESAMQRAQQEVMASAKKIDQLSKELKDAQRQIRELGSRFDRESRRVESASDRAKRSVGGLRSTLIGLTAYFGGREVIEYSDRWNNAANQLRMVTNTTEQLTKAQTDLLGIANDTRSEFGSTANLFSRLARSTTELSLSYTDLLGLTKTINQAFAVSGATTEEASAAITQLSQGLASGALRGDEFNSVAEQAPSIMRAIADSLGMSIGQLRQFASTGGITAEIVVNALKQVSSSMDNQFSKSMATFGQNTIVARNNLTSFIGESSMLQGIIGGVGSTIRDVSGGMASFTKEIDVMTGAVGGAILVLGGLRGALQLARVAQLAFNAAVTANPYVIVAVAVGALIGVLYSLRNETLEIADTTATVGEWISSAWELVTETIVDVWNEITGPIRRTIDSFSSYFKAAAEGMGIAWQTASDAIVSITKWLINGLIAAFRGVAAAIAQIFYNMADNIATVFNGVVDAVKAVGRADWEGVGEALNRKLVNPFNNVMGAFVAENKDYLGEWGDAWVTRVQQNTLELKPLTDWLLKTDSATKRVKKTAGLTAEELRKQKKALEALRKEAEKFAQSLQRIFDNIDPVGAAYRKYAADQAILNAAVSKGVITFQAYFDAIEKLKEAQRSPQTASEAYSQGFGAEIASRGAVGSPTDPQETQQTPMQKWLDGAKKAFTDFEAMSANVADNFTTQFGNAFESVIMHTSSLKDAFSELARSMLGSIVNAIGQMIAQWLAYQAVTLALGQQGTTAAVAEATTAGPAIAAAYAPAAAATSLASFGTNAGPAIAGITATNAVAQGFAGMFDKGGDIRRGQWGIAGEKGAEIVSGPATVTSRRQTASMMGTGGAPVVNIYPNDPGVSDEQGATAEQMDDGTLDIRMARIITKGGTKTARAINATTGTKRRGTI